MTSGEEARHAFRSVIVSSRAGATGLPLTARPIELPLLAIDRPTTTAIRRLP